MSQEYAEFLETLGEQAPPPAPAVAPARTPFRHAIEGMRAYGGAHFLVVRVMGDLAGDELDVVGLVIERLKAGRLVYGTFDVRNDVRDFDAEATDECLDAAVYLAVGLLQRRGVA